MATSLHGLGLSSDDRRIAVKIFVTIYLISALFFKPSPTFYRFVSLTKSLAHYGTTSIDKVHEGTGLTMRDEVKFGGRTYLAVNPGLSFFALVGYAPYGKFLLPKLKQFSRWDPTLDFVVSQFVMALSTVVFFTALLIALFFLALRQAGCHRMKALILAGLLYLGTPILYYSLSVTNGQNALEMSLLFLAFFLTRNKAGGAYQIFFSGLLSGLAIFASITAVFLFPLFLWVLWKSKRWLVVAWLVGVCFGSMPLWIYQFISFGQPFRVSTFVYTSNVPQINLAGIIHAAWNLLVDSRVGLFPFSPFFIALILFFKKIVVEKQNRFILIGVLIYLLGAAACFYEILLFNPVGDRWYALLGGGGCRYLLPVLPFLIYALASVQFHSSWKGKMISFFMLVSVLINVPALFWSGGEEGVLNHLLLFLKNGFHSYTIDLIKDVLIVMGFNADHFSLPPVALALMLVIWWMWVGERWLREWLKGG